VQGEVKPKTAEHADKLADKRTNGQADSLTDRQTYAQPKKLVGVMRFCWIRNFEFLFQLQVLLNNPFQKAEWMERSSTDLDS